MMRCDLDSGVGRLTKSLAELRERVQDVKTQWNDATMQQFEDNHLREIPARMRLLATAIERLSEVVAQAERECSDRDETQ